MKNTKIPNLKKIRPVEDEFSHAEKQTDGLADTTKLRFAFRNFANAPDKKLKYVIMKVFVSCYIAYIVI